MSKNKNKKSTKKSKKYALGGSVLNMETPAEIASKFKLQGEKALASAASDPLSVGLQSLSGLMLGAAANKILPNLDGLGDIFKKGAYGGTMGSNVELEGQELGQLPTGETFAVEGPSHQNGGVGINLPEGTDIFSKRIKIDGESMAKRKGKREKKSKTFEELMGKYKHDQAINNAAKRTKAVNDKENEFDVQIQNVIREMENSSGSKQYATGGTVPPPFELYSGLNWEEVEPYFTRFSDYHKLPPETAASTVQEMLGLTGESVDNQFGKESFGRLKNYAYPSGLEPVAPSNSSILPSEMFNTEYFTGSKTKGVERDSNLDSRDPNMLPSTALGTLGTLVSGFGPLLNNNANRKGDTANVNPFKDYGQESLKVYDQLMQNAEQLVNKQLGDVELARNAQQGRMRNGARSVNTLRGLDTMVDLNADRMRSDLYDKLSAASSEIASNKSNTQLAIDERVMAGEGARDLADRQDRDAYYTNRGSAISNLGSGFQSLAKAFGQTEMDTTHLDWIKQMEKQGITASQIAAFFNSILRSTNNMPTVTEEKKP